ncbi:hypothetical protein F5Y16DRAFT_367121 [Xylariaceae sp. FL0255]|nr:hypothetical protein F5Y16DRAFT_367121 [Xylariaceae sp. FL0255]
MPQIRPRLNTRNCLAVIDQCTQHAALYFQSDQLVEFWRVMAGTLAWSSPVTAQELQRIVDSICHDRRGCLLRGEIPPRKAETEMLDSAIDNWLEIEGQRAFDRNIRSILDAARLAFGPEETSVENLLTEHCRARWKSNEKDIALQTTENHKEGRVKGTRLFQAIRSSITAVDSRQPSPKPLHMREAALQQHQQNNQSENSDLQAFAQLRMKSSVPQDQSSPLNLGTLTPPVTCSPLDMGTLTPDACPSIETRSLNIGTLTTSVFDGPFNVGTYTPSTSSSTEASVTDERNLTGSAEERVIKRRKVNDFASRLAGSSHDVYEFRETPDCDTSSASVSESGFSEEDESTPTRPRKPLLAKCSSPRTHDGMEMEKDGYAELDHRKDTNEAKSNKGPHNRRQETASCKPPATPWSAGRVYIHSGTLPSTVGRRRGGQHNDSTNKYRHQCRIPA